MKKIIIWGHKLGSHTHAYVHYGYCKAATYLGYETYWLDGTEDIKNLDLSNSIFITEGQVSKNIPIFENSIYFDHFSDKPFELTENFSQHRLNHKNYYNFVYFSDNWGLGITHPPKNELIEVADKHLYHEKTKTLTTFWATDLLPYEIDKLEPCLFDENLNYIYFIGSKQGSNINEFEKICNLNNKLFKNYGGWQNVKTGIPIEENIKNIRNSYISFDIREWESHMKGGRYYPCRLFKNISYGKWSGTNHVGIEDIFEDHITCESNLPLLYEKLVKESKDADYNKIKKAMNFIKNKHTYVNRLQDMFKIIN